MKKIKVKFVGYWDNIDLNGQLIYRMLSKMYDLELSEEPDYVICGCFGKPYEYCQYPQVRIMNVGENYIPDFNLIDYAICPYPIVFQDRCYYKPAFVDTSAYFSQLKSGPRTYPENYLESKQYFANFIAGHESEYGIRGDFFRMLSRYKRVESPGTYLNNTNGEIVSFKNSSKTDFQKKCKFTLCFESTSHNGFITEKLTDAFFADTIPVYYGSPSATEIFNHKAFINCTDYPSFEAVIERIIELDQDDDQYMEMLRQPIFNDDLYQKTMMDGLEKYLRNIFDQPLEKAYRRSRVYIPKQHEDYLTKARDPYTMSVRELFWVLIRKMRNRFSGR